MNTINDTDMFIVREVPQNTITPFTQGWRETSTSLDRIAANLMYGKLQPDSFLNTENKHVNPNISEQGTINNLCDKFEHPVNSDINATLDTSRGYSLDYTNPDVQGWNKCYISDCNGRSFFKINEGQDTSILNGPLCDNAVFESPTQSGNIITSWTDEFGRIEKMAIDKIECFDGARDLNQQRNCNDLKNGLTSDDAGHLLAREFGGPKEQFNLIPMDSYTNRHGEWRYMEQEWKKSINEGKSISDVSYQVYYEGDSKRPTGFDVSYKVDGEIETRYIDNSPTRS